MCIQSDAGPFAILTSNQIQETLGVHQAIFGLRKVRFNGRILFQKTLQFALANQEIWQTFYCAEHKQNKMNIVEIRYRNVEDINVSRLSLDHSDCWQLQLQMYIVQVPPIQNNSESLAMVTHKLE